MIDYGILENETLDDLQVNNLMLIQKRDGFRFGIDAVLLAAFASSKRLFDTADFCSGSGVVSLLTVGKYGCKSSVQYELQQDYCEMARRTVLLNGLEERVKTVCCDIRNKEELPVERYDLITCNPPYFPQRSGAVTAESSAAIARHEIYCDIESVSSAASRALKYGGRLALVHRPERLADIMWFMRSNKIEPKRIKPVCSKAGQPPSILLVEGIKGGKPGIIWEPTVVVYENDGNYSEEINRIYGRID